MHPNLDDPGFIDCSDLIEALNNCHYNLSFMERQFKCNNISEDVKRCLHEARMLRRRQNNKEGRERTARIGAFMNRMRERDEEDYEVARQMAMKELASREKPWK
ncbi:hypothetical protein V1525DRAFT_392386 [Lipomyces kononenkoae]|uniref:Uncharacterized protein n=1 Tax=Lipomyces kononenkoae TaxID=34357 RepID=A0ACC3TCD4_LIPKO